MSRSLPVRWQRLVRAGVLLAAMARPLVAAPPPPDAILIDAGSGAVLRERGADTAHVAPSLSPLMIALVTFEHAALGLVPLTTTVTLGPAGAAAAASGVRIPLHSDKAYPLSEVLKAMLLTGADDAAVALAEAVAGSIDGCVELMNARAQRLGLTATHYTGVGRLLAANTAAGTTTGRDVARLARALVSHPTVLEWTSITGFPFDHGAVLLRNANHLLGTVAGADGLYVSAEAARGKQKPTHALVASARRGGLRLIAVVLGATDSAAGFTTAAEWLEWGFREYERVTVLSKGDRLKAAVQVRNGTVSEVSPAATETVSFLRRRGEEREIVMRYQLPNEVLAPVARDQRLGELLVEEGGKLIAVVPLVSSARVPASQMMSGDLP